MGLGTLSVGALLWSEARGWLAGRWAFKTFASLMFVAVGWTSGAEPLIFWGLILGLVGDVLLIPEGKGWFLSGLAAFLLGHLLYVPAFARRAAWDASALPAVLGVGAVSLTALLWLWPRLGPMRRPVLAYVSVISAMAVAAWAVWLSGGRDGARIAIGATLFYFSDLSVAIDKFVGRRFLNKAWGLPFYYAGQFLIAVSA